MQDRAKKAADVSILDSTDAPLDNEIAPSWQAPFSDGQTV